ncbi:MAG: hypothetical protein NW218_11890 [Saprospiraceae bacterium]|nr:hypothetical protein [Saprospiraceae bacterium]
MLKLIEQNITKPIVQAGLVFTLGILLMVCAWILTVTNLFLQDPLFPWSISSAFLLLFALFNSLLSLRADNFAKYWGNSVYSYLALAFSSGLAAWLFSGIDLRDAGTYRWIYLVVTFGFLVFLSMVNFMKRIVNFAEKEEWNQPRKRR